ncbi:hypothetical protein [Halocynthiibacter namhaensis]|uniref:hypothetical protein n=1 Tax=Halocynthiibacter namhaensis TaxID=1290553 RepID=UPI0005791089|nr:hypothetical protein [Halocynthiibacter namhaensis]
MNFLGKDAISRATRVSSRTVLIVSVTLLAFSMEWVTIPEGKIFGVQFSDGYLIWALRCIVVYNLFSHLVHWYGDFVSYKGWNITGRKPQAMARLGPANTYNFIQSFMLDVARAQVNALENDDRAEKLDFTDDLKEQFLALNNALYRFASFATLYVWGWFLLLPVGCGILSLIASFYTIGSS